MYAWMAFSLFTTWFAADPAAPLFPFRATSAQPIPNTASTPYSIENRFAETQTFLIPPAPLPEFSPVETPSLHYEFSSQESCRDSNDLPPAPPAELEAVDLTPSMIPWLGRIIQTHQPCDYSDKPANLLDHQQESQLDPVLEHPDSTEKLHHLKTAIQHLKAAGMKQAANQLRTQYHAAVGQLREKIRQEISEKEQEQQRLAQEIANLKNDLVGDASLEMKLEICEFRWGEIRKLADHPDKKIRMAALLVLEASDRDSSAPFWGEPQLNKAIRTLIENKSIPVIASPTITTRNGEEGTITTGGLRTNAQGELEETTTQLSVQSEIRENQQIQCRIKYRYSVHHDDSQDVSAGECTEIIAAGDTACLGGFVTTTQKTVRQAQHVVIQRDQKVSVVFVTPQIHPEEDSTNIENEDNARQAAGFPEAKSSMTDGQILKVEGRELPVESLQRMLPQDRGDEVRPAPAPQFHLIPSPESKHQPKLMLPMSPMRSPVETPRLDESKPILPPFPSDDEESTRTVEEEKGPII